MLNRRKCLIPFLACAISPLAVWGQPQRPYRIGWLTPSTVPEAEREFRAAMARLGYIEGRHVLYNSQSAEDDLRRLPTLAALLVSNKMDVIVAVSPYGIVKARQATDTIPIVMAFWGGQGLLESGYVHSLSHPGGTVTGVSMLGDELEGKRLELLLDLVPTARRIGVLWPGSDFESQHVERVSRAAGVVLRVVPTGEGNDSYRRAFSTLEIERVDALLVASHPRYLRDAKQIIDLAALHRLPAIYEWPVMAVAGGLIAYGPRMEVLEARVASYVDRILRGAKPGNLPIEQPSTFEMVVNQVTARNLGIVVPGQLMLRADRVIS
ncbi:MAG: ABC transporter substrate-binding protein [Caldimonas sp.]